MKLRIFWCALLTVLASINLNAQPKDRYLISITLDGTCDLDKLEALHLPLYHRFETTLVAGLPADMVDALLAAGIPFRIVDEAPWTEKYYLVTTRKGALRTEHLTAAYVLAEDESAALVKSPSSEALNLDPAIYKSVEVPGSARYFSNERIIQNFRASPGTDSLVTSITAEISPDSVQYFIQSLQNFGTRNWQASNQDSVVTWIRDQFLRMGYTHAVIDSFQYRSTWQKNVVATFPGTATADRVIVIGGHHDSIVFDGGNALVYAPGADDNASGTAAVLEIARVMSRRGYRPESTIKFMTFAAEEVGLVGSSVLAQRARASGDNITLMVNQDMISNSPRPLPLSPVNVYYYSGYENLRDVAMSMVTRFTQLTPKIGGANSSGSDSYSFWANGFPAVYFEEGDFSPNWHKRSDVLTNCNTQYCAEIIKASCATVIYHSSTPQPVRNLVIADIGTGTSLLVRWQKNLEPDLVGYSVHVGTSSGLYDSVYAVQDTTFNVGNLAEGMRYYIGISAVNISGNESPITERSGIPRLRPQAPSNLAAEPKWHMVSLQWSPNRELDLAGYNIYRSTSLEEVPSKLNSSVLEDTTFLDSDTKNGQYYYYSVTAIDSAHNESSSGTTIRSRAVSMDQGILIADETQGGDGSPMKPTDAQVDSFYQWLVSGFATQLLDVEAQGSATLADLGAYSSVLWHGNDISSRNVPLNSQQTLKKYLSYGGRLFISSYRPTAAFANNTTTPRDFVPGEFMYDYLKISRSENKFGARFIGADPLVPGYQAIDVDTNKTQASMNYHLTTIESIKAAPGASDIYRYETNYDTTQLEGRMKGQPVGIEYLGSDFKLVVVSFPLYYMDFGAAQNLVRFVLGNRFSEPAAVAEQRSPVPERFELNQNYPNPFNPSTTIQFSIPAGTQREVSLRVFNVLGQQVATLVNEGMDPGTHTVSFDAGESGGLAVSLPSGVYFYRLRVGPLVETKKMLLLR